MNMMNLDLINKTFYPGWLMVSQLRSGQEIQDGDALYRRACRWVAEAREALTDGGYSAGSCDRMLYAYCALLDESVLNRDRQDDGYRSCLTRTVRFRWRAWCSARRQWEPHAA